MRVIIAGSRNIHNYDDVIKGIFLALWYWKKTYEDVSEVVSGNARGVDLLGVKWAIRNNIKYTLYPAHWNRYGKRAGYVRNTKMAENAEALIAIWDGESKGTKHMIDIAKRKGLKVFVYEIN